MKLLVTGGLGFIGSNFIIHVLKNYNDFEIINLDAEDYSINLQIHTTKDINDSHVNGSLTVIWRDYDNIINNNPKMVYMSSVNPNEVKGPHTHTKRNSYFSCIHGNVIFIIKNPDGSYSEIESNPENGVMVFVVCICRLML